MSSRPSVTNLRPQMRVALLDDYQAMALTLAPWHQLPEGTVVESFTTPALNSAILVERLRAFDVVVLMRERTAFPAAVIEALPKLRLLVCTGLRNPFVDLKACRRHGVMVCSSPGGIHGVAATAELTWSLVLGLFKQSVYSHEAMHQGVWQPVMARPLAGAVLGLAGLGKVGHQVARMGQAFGMKVIAWSPHLTKDRARSAGVEAVTCDELFSCSDVVSLHLVLGPETAQLVSKERLGQMKPDACLINTARAGLVDEEALLAALRAQKIGGAGLDVFWQEPLPPDHELLRLKNVMLSPHLGYVTRENLAAFYAGALANIQAWMSGRTPSPLND